MDGVKVVSTKRDAAIDGGTRFNVSMMLLVAILFSLWNILTAPSMSITRAKTDSTRFHLEIDIALHISNGRPK